MYQLLVSFFLFCSSALLLNATTFYVNLNATSSANDGTSWTDAYINLQDAIDIAKSGDQIWVATGTYFPTLVFDVNNPDKSDLRTRTFYINTDGIEIYGGFAGTETQLADRDITLNPTILSGDFDENDSSTGKLGTQAFSLINNEENAYHVVFVDGTTTKGSITTSTIIDGFQIIGGNANGKMSNNTGGGMYNNGYGKGKNCSPTIRNCFFTKNTASNYGGGMYNNGYNEGKSNVAVINCFFTQNIAGLGGGMYNNGYNNGTSNATITDCFFAQNLAVGGGGIYNNGYNGGVSNVVLTGSTFSQNTANSGGGVSNFGINGTSNATMTRCTFSQNTATINGGGVYNYGFAKGVSNALLNACTFSQNAATSGGGVFNYGALGASNATMIGCSFSQNVAKIGGGIYNYGYNGGASNAILTACSFAQNAATREGAAVYSKGAFGKSNSTIQNCIFWGTASGSDVIYNDTATGVISYSIYDDGAADGIVTLPTGMTDGGNNIEQDPLFFNPIGINFKLPPTD